MKAYFQLKKNEEDGAACNTKEALVMKCLAMDGRATPEYKKDDNEDDNNEDENDKDDNDDNIEQNSNNNNAILPTS